MTLVDTTGMVVSIVLGTIGLVALFGTYAISIVSYIRKAIKNTIAEKHLRRNIRDRVRDDKRKREREQKDYGKKHNRNREDNYSTNSENSFSYCDHSIRYSMPC